MRRHRFPQRPQVRHFSGSRRFFACRPWPTFIDVKLSQNSLSSNLRCTYPWLTFVANLGYQYPIHHVKQRGWASWTNMQTYNWHHGKLVIKKLAWNWVRWGILRPTLDRHWLMSPCLCKCAWHGDGGACRHDMCTHGTGSLMNCGMWAINRITYWMYFTHWNVQSGL